MMLNVIPVRVDEVDDADGGSDDEAEGAGDEHAPEAPTHLELEQDILEDEKVRKLEYFLQFYESLL